jgi:hypothetical protein
MLERLKRARTGRRHEADPDDGPHTREEAVESDRRQHERDVWAGGSSEISRKAADAAFKAPR